ncbi:two-component system response regulator [Methylomonas rhizoryzae]|uniref:two-component system response regulator n=1 Tax=Methylomonas rhizoryzae TaxID=2608981 RepID=UPI00123262F3|nr:EAL domain-containing protein [Methylomonas rhizoryzae]
MYKLSGPPKRLLLVDDDPRNIKILEMFVKTAGHDCRGAANGNAALQLCRSWAPDLLLLDIILPDMTGIDIVRILKADPTTADIPIIMLTASADRAACLQALAAGADDYLHRPVDRDELSIRIGNLLRVKERNDLLRERLELVDQLATVAATVPGLIFSMQRRQDGQLSLPFASSAIEDLFGMTPEQVQNDAAGLLAQIHPDDATAFLSAMQVSAQGLTPLSTQWRMHHPIRGERWIECHARPHRIADGGILWHGHAQDISEAKSAERQLRIAAVAFESQDGMVVTDATGTILQVNQAFSTITGLASAETIGKHPLTLQNGHIDENLNRVILQSLRHEGRWEGEVRSRSKDGAIDMLWLSISSVNDRNGRISHYVASLSSISEPRVAQRKILELAMYDHLTGLPNRRLFFDRLHQALLGAHRSGGYGALLLIDLDRFHDINDSHGHETGDNLLIDIGKRIQQQLRGGDSVSRPGGDEFLVLLDEPGSDLLTAAAACDSVVGKMRDAINQPLWIDGLELQITASIGITLFHDHDSQSPEKLLKQAELALYQAKQSGRDNFRFFEMSMQETLLTRTRIESGLRLALRDGHLLLFYQPQVASDGKLLGAEALIRWQPPQQALISPALFIPIAENSTIILAIGHWILTTACRQLVAWSQDPATRQLVLAVNISARQLLDPGLEQMVKDILEQTGANPTLLKLELTESAVLGNIESAISTMHKIKALGVSFSMDDFGTGYSSLTNLKRLPLDQIKIDQSFVRDIPADQDDYAIVSAIIGMGNSLRLQVIAEGVETLTQFNALAELGCDAYQGYLFGKPGPAEMLEAIARQRCG